MDELTELLSTPDSLRDTNWENRFLKTFPVARLKILSEDPQVGPDGWPYLFAEVNANATEPAQKVLYWLAERGIGLAVNPQKNYPDYVFTYGMIWHFRHKGFFESVTQKEPDKHTYNIHENQKFKIKKLADELLPIYARKIIKEFFRDQGIYFPKALLISHDGNSYDLAFSLESLGSPPQEELNNILEALSWFFPQGLSLSLLREVNFPQFEPL